MAFRFRIGRPIDKEAQRIVLSQVHRAHAALTQASDLDKAIHECRKSLKRVRALLRLVRPALDAEQFRATDATVRDIARGLSGSRDRVVAAATLVAIEARAGVEAGSYTSTFRIAEAGTSVAAAAAGTDPAKAADAAASLLGVRDDLADLGRAPLTRATILDGFERGFSAARQHLVLAYAASDEEPMHDWRKRVQRHWRHLQLIERIWPAEMAARIAEAQVISELIGEHQDLSVLKRLVAEGAGERRLRRLAREVTGHCEARQAEIRRLARPHGERLLADGASAFARRIDVYWSAAEHEREEAKAARSAAKGTPSKV